MLLRTVTLAGEVAAGTLVLKLVAGLAVMATTFAALWAWVAAWPLFSRVLLALSGSILVSYGLMWVWRWFSQRRRLRVVVEPGEITVQRCLLERMLILKQVDFTVMERHEVSLTLWCWAGGPEPSRAEPSRLDFNARRGKLIPTITCIFPKDRFDEDALVLEIRDRLSGKSVRQPLRVQVLPDSGQVPD